MTTRTKAQPDAPAAYSRHDGRVLNPHAWRHYRRSYARGEVLAGATVVVGLIAVGAWVRWMGAHPDPSLARVSLELLAGDAARLVVESALPGAGRAGTEAAARVVARGALPADLAPPGFAEGNPSVFDADTLYEKIDGRANYFIARGFRALSFVSLTRAGSDGTSLDLELYDMGSAENALSAYGGEKPAEVEPERHLAGLWHLDRNALYLTQGRYYVRAIGSDESEATRAALLDVKERIQAAFPDEAQDLPWAHGLFDALGIPAGRVELHREAAFSFGFAKDVYSALLDDGATELYVTVAADEAAAGELAGRFVDGFASYGERVTAGGAVWVRDRYLGSYATARSNRALVLGVRGAPDLDSATSALGKLAAAVAELPAMARGASPVAASPDSPEPAGDRYPGGGEQGDG